MADDQATPQSAQVLAFKPRPKPPTPTSIAEQYALSQTHTERALAAEVAALRDTIIALEGISAAQNDMINLLLKRNKRASDAA